MSYGKEVSKTLKKTDIEIRCTNCSPLKLLAVDVEKRSNTISIKRLLLSIILMLVLFNNAFGQALRNKEIEKVFLGLPIDTNLVTLLNAANTNKFINKYKDININEENYFTGYFSVHDYFELQPLGYQIEIFTCEEGYYIAGEIVDSILVIAIYAKYGKDLTKDIERQYEKIIKRFKKISADAREFQTYAESGKVEDCFYFFCTKEEKNPYLTVCLSNGGCITSYSIHIIYTRVGKWY